MPDERTYFYKMWHQLCKTIEDPKKRLALYEAILEYAFSGTMPKDLSTPLMQTIFEMAKARIDATMNRSVGHKRANRSPDLPEIIPSKSQDLPDNYASKSEDSPTLFPSSSQDLPENIRGNEKKNEKVFPASTPFKNQEKKQGDIAHANTDAHKENRDTDFEELMPEHLRGYAEFRVEWRAWLDYRRSRRKPVSKEAAKRQLKLLGDYPPAAAISIIENSLTNDWQGLFPERPCTKPTIQPKKDYTGL